MSKRQTLMALGIWIAVLPFLGFPGTWKAVLFVITGIIVASIAYSLMPTARPKSSPPNVTYREHKTDLSSLPKAIPEVFESVPPPSSTVVTETNDTISSDPSSTS